MQFLVDWTRLEKLVDGEMRDGELPINALRRLMLEGRITKKNLFDSRGFGSKGYRSLLGVLKLKETEEEVFVSE